MLICLLILTLFLSLHQAWYWYGLFGSLRKARVLSDRTHDKLVSVIIAARNEATNLRKNLPLFLQQNYDNYEVIVVNDNSTDDTRKAVLEFTNRFNQLYLLDLPQHQWGKGAALQKGIQASRGDLLLFTDADCYPASNRWLREMSLPLQLGYDLALGAAPLFPDQPGCAPKFASYDAALTYVQYGSATVRKQAYMGVGRNLACTKSAAMGWQKGKSSQYVGGHDDLFVNAASHNSKIWLVHNPCAYTYSPAASSWSTLARQKRRHVSVSRSYRRVDQGHLFLFAVSHWLHYLCIVMLLLIGMHWLALLSYVIKAMPLLRTFERSLARFAPLSKLEILFADLVYLVWYPYIAFCLFRKPPKQW